MSLHAVFLKVPVGILSVKCFFFFCFLKDVSFVFPLVSYEAFIDTDGGAGK